jgi:hypothetical protein
MAVTHTVADNITLGRGRMYLAPFIAGTTTPHDAELYLGNTPGCSLTGVPYLDGGMWGLGGEWAWPWRCWRKWAST